MNFHFFYCVENNESNNNNKCKVQDVNTLHNCPSTPSCLRPFPALTASIRSPLFQPPLAYVHIHLVLGSP